MTHATVFFKVRVGFWENILGGYFRILGFLDSSIQTRGVKWCQKALVRSCREERVFLGVSSW
jgi:hypothetical protein